MFIIKSGFFGLCKFSFEKKDYEIQYEPLNSTLPARTYVYPIHHQTILVLSTTTWQYRGAVHHRDNPVKYNTYQ